MSYFGSPRTVHAGMPMKKSTARSNGRDPSARASAAACDSGVIHASRPISFPLDMDALLDARDLKQRLAHATQTAGGVGESGARSLVDVSLQVEVDLKVADVGRLRVALQPGFCRDDRLRGVERHAVALRFREQRVEQAL